LSAQRNGHRAAARPRAVALFGGSFDPVHVGHLAVARAAQRRFRLDEVRFVVSGRPPHKPRHDLSPFADRYAMAALACAEHPYLFPSLAEAPFEHGPAHAFYSIDTVRQARRELHGAGDRLYFLLGADSFLQIPTWKDYEALLAACDFIVASRPGFRMDALRLVIPPELFGRPHPGRAESHTIHLRRTSVHLLDAVVSHVSSTEVRRRRRRGQSIHGLVPVRVEEYILKQDLYRS
jgi:nicotinate-nucleotide adenylyltransferase